jgi:hypothetical protein
MNGHVSRFLNLFWQLLCPAWWARSHHQSSKSLDWPKGVVLYDHKEEHFMTDSDQTGPKESWPKNPMQNFMIEISFGKIWIVRHFTKFPMMSLKKKSTISATKCTSYSINFKMKWTKQAIISSETYVKIMPRFKPIRFTLWSRRVNRIDSSVQRQW